MNAGSLLAVEKEGGLEVGMPCRYESTNVANVDRVEAALHALFADSEINGRRVLLSKMAGAGTASGSFDREGYCV